MTPFEASCEAVFSLLESYDDMNDTARKMVRNAAPLALRAPSAQRHKFQHDLVASLREALGCVRQQRQKDTDEVAAKCSEGMKSKDRSTEDLKVAMDARSTLSEKRNAAKALMDSCEAGVNAAVKAVEAEKQKLAELRAANEETCAKKGHMEKLINETFAQVKLGGQQWRTRNKMIDDILAALSELDKERSILDALPVALKSKDRGEFAEAAVDYAEKVLQKSLAALESTLQGHDDTVFQQEASIKAEEESLVDARAALEKSGSDYVVAENALLAGDEVAAQQAEGLAKSEATCKSLEASLAGARGKLEHADAILERFRALQADGEAATAPASAMPVGEEEPAAPNA